MIPNTIDQITAADIQQLVDAQAEEGPTLEFKRDLPRDDRDSRKEFVADVCALANSKGGDMVFGIEEGENGAAGRVVPQDFNADSVITQLANVLADGLEPRLHGVLMRAVDIENGKVLVIRVPRSFSGIHRSARDAHFWVRESRSKRQLDVAGITSRVAEVLGRQDRLADFFARRYAAVVTGAYPLQLAAGPKVVVHVIPTRDIQSGEEIDMRPIADAGQFWVIPSSTSSFATHTLEGILHHPPVNEATGTVRAATLVFRSGVVEAVSEARSFRPDANGPEYISLEAVEAQCVQFLQRSLQLTAQQIAGGWPLTVRIAIAGHGQMGAKSISQDVRWDFDHIPMVRVHAPVVQLPDVLIEELPASVPLVLREAFNRLWQAWGYPRSFSFQTRHDGTALWQTHAQR
jgi:hypothetical protein